MIKEQSQFKALKVLHPPLMNYELRITNYELRITDYELRITNEEAGKLVKVVKWVNLEDRIN
jgi:hypothetical protein